MEQYYIYSTASTVAAFINGFHIEQAYGFNYKETVPKVPIYGYNDYEFSKVLRGKGIVQGMLVVNFVFPGYLSAVLTHRNDVYNPKYNTNFGFPVGPSTNRQFQERVFNQLQSELPANDDAASKRARAEYIANLITRNGVSDGELENVTDAIAKFISPSPKTYYKNEKVRKSLHEINSPLIADSKATKGNDLDIYYQDPDLSTWFVRFNNVHFTDVSQSISQAGAEGSSEPLYEIYEFIAKSKEIIEIK